MPKQTRLDGFQYTYQSDSGSGQYFYHVTTKEAAEQIIASGEL